MVYFVQQGNKGPIKIGTSINPLRRLSELQTSHHEQLNIIGVVEGDKTVEKVFHKLFEKFRLYGEWFKPSKDIIDCLLTFPQIALDPLEYSNREYVRPNKTLPQLLNALEKIIIKEALVVNGTQTGAAKTLGITKSLLQYKMKKYDLFPN